MFSWAPQLAQGLFHRTSKLVGVAPTECLRIRIEIVHGASVLCEGAAMLDLPPSKSRGASPRDLRGVDVKPRRGDSRSMRSMLSPLRGYNSVLPFFLGLAPQAMCYRHFVAKKCNIKTQASHLRWPMNPQVRIPGHPQQVPFGCNSPSARCKLFCRLSFAGKC